MDTSALKRVSVKTKRAGDDVQAPEMKDGEWQRDPADAGAGVISGGAEDGSSRRKKADTKWLFAYEDANYDK